MANGRVFRNGGEGDLLLGTAEVKPASATALRNPSWPARGFTLF